MDLMQKDIKWRIIKENEKTYFNPTSSSQIFDSEITQIRELDFEGQAGDRYEKRILTGDRPTLRQAQGKLGVIDL